MIHQHIEIVGLNRVLSGLGNIDRGLETLKPLWEQFQSQFHAEESALFASAPWTPLSPAYAERKRKEVGSKPILQRTGTLLRSLTEPKARGSITRINDMDAEFGSSIFYGIFHQLGTARMPARPPLANPDERVYGTIAGRYLSGMLTRAGFN